MMGFNRKRKTEIFEDIRIMENAALEVLNKEKKMSALGSLVVKLALEHAEYVQGLDKSEQAALKFALNAQKNFDQAANSVQGFLTDTAKNVAGAVVAFSGITSAIGNTQKSLIFLTVWMNRRKELGRALKIYRESSKRLAQLGNHSAPLSKQLRA